MLSMITTSGDNSHDEIYGTPTKKGKFQTKMCSNQPGAKHPTSGDRKRKHISAESTGAKLRAVEHKSASQMLSAEALLGLMLVSGIQPGQEPIEASVASSLPSTPAMNEVAAPLSPVSTIPDHADDAVFMQQDQTVATKTQRPFQAIIASPGLSPRADSAQSNLEMLSRAIVCGAERFQQLKGCSGEALQSGQRHDRSVFIERARAAGLTGG